MKNYSKLPFYGSIALLFAISTFWACQKENIVTNTNTKFTPDALSNDADYLDYIIAFNEMQAKFSFLDKSKSLVERTAIIEELGNIAQILNQKGSEAPENVQQRASELLGFLSISDMNAFYKELSQKKKKILDKYAFMKEPNTGQNWVFLQRAYALSQRYLQWVIVFNKENGTYVLNKLSRNSDFTDVSNNVSSYSTESEQNQVANYCEKEAAEKLRNAYIRCETMLQEQLGGAAEINCSNSSLAAFKYGSSIRAANQDYEQDSAKCH